VVEGLIGLTPFYVPVRKSPNWMMISGEKTISDLIVLPNLTFPMFPRQFPMTKGARFSFLNKQLFHHLDQFTIL
jgi:hypothetical protein